MPLKGYHAVLTADVVNSTGLAPAALEKLLRKIAKALEARLFESQPTFEVFRGDSWQAILPPEQALATALLWRAALRAQGARLDIRVAIGIGPVAHRAKTLSHSGGDAFVWSGTLLDQLKRSAEPNLGVQTRSAEWNAHLRTECILAEDTIRRWTPAAAEAVYLTWMHGDTQQQLAKRLKMTQPAVHKRLASASWPAIRYWEEDYRRQLAHYLEAV